MSAVPFFANAIAIGGGPASGARLQSYVKSTTTPLGLWTDSGLSVPSTNPVIADADGRFEIYADSTEDYTWQIRSSDSATVLWEADITGGVLVVTYVNGILIEGSWGLALANPLGAGWSNAFGLPVSDLIDDLSGIRVKQTYADMDAMAETELTDGCVIYTVSPQGLWQYNEASVAAADGGTVREPTSSAPGRFERLFEGAANPEWFDAVSGDTGNQTQAFIDTIGASVETFIPDGTYRHSASITVTDTTPGKLIRGADPRRTLLKMTPGTEFTQLAITSSEVDVRDIGFQGSFDPGVYEPASTRCAILVNNASPLVAANTGFRARRLNFYDQLAGAIFVSGGNQGAINGRIEDIYAYRMSRYGGATLFKNVRDYVLSGITTEYGGPCLAGDDGTDGDAYVTTITSISKATQAVVTKAGHDVEVGDYLYCYGIGGMTELNGNTYEVVAADATTFTLDVNSTGFGSYTSGGYMTSLRPLVNITHKDILSRADGKYMGVGEGIIGYSGLQGATFDNVVIEDGGYTDHLDISTHRAVRAVLMNSGQDGLHRPKNIVFTGLKIRRFSSQPIILSGCQNVTFEDWEVEDCWRQNSDPGGDCPVFSLTDDAAGNSCEGVTIGRGKVIKQSNSYATCLVKNSCANAQNINIDWGRISLPSSFAGYVEAGQTTNTQDY